MEPVDVSWRFGKTFTAGELSRAVAHLSREDPKLRTLISKVGRLRLHRGLKPFEALVVSIIFQQLAGSAAEAILGRFKAVYGSRFPGPDDVLATSDAELRATGLSRKKIEYMKDLSRRVADGSLDLSELPPMSDESIIARLDEVKGIGRWTAQMFLIFTLRRPDVLPSGDLGIRAAVKKLYGLQELPTEKELESIGSRWHPYCSIAALYLWRLSEIQV